MDPGNRDMIAPLHAAARALYARTAQPPTVEPILRILTVVGARPQFVKAAAISRAIAARDDVSEILVHTGQHFDPGVSRIFFDELQIPEPGINLGIHGGGHGEMTGRMLAGARTRDASPRAAGSRPGAGRHEFDIGRRIRGRQAA